MLSYRPDHFADAFARYDGAALWTWLHSRDVLIRLETAATLRRPAVEALSPLLDSTFGEKMLILKFRQMVGHMVRQVMEAHGYHLRRSNVRISRPKSLYGYGSVYELPSVA